MANKVTIIEGICGCLHAIYDPASILVSPYITEDSPTDIFSPEFQPYRAAENEDTFYVPHNYTGMPDQIPKKFAEITEAPSLTEFDSFVGTYIDPETDEPTDYRFSPAQLVTYIIANTTVLLTVNVNDETYNNAWFMGKGIIEIVTNGQTYLLGADFTQGAGGITWINGATWYDGQVARFKI